MRLDIVVLAAIMLLLSMNTSAQSYGKTNFDFANNNPKFTFYINSFFHFGYGKGPKIVGYQTRLSNDTLYVYGFYDLRGAFALVGSTSQDTFHYELKTTGINYFNISTNSIDYCVDPKTGWAIETCRDTTWAESDSTFSIHPNSIQNFGETTSLYFYPNPVENLLNIHCSKATNGSLRIRSIDGRILRSMAIKDSELSIDLSDLSPGIYFIQLSTPGGASILEKFVKE